MRVGSPLTHPMPSTTDLHRLSLSVMLGAGLAALLPAMPGAAETPRLSRDVVLGPQVWTPTDLDIRPGERVVFAAQGAARCPGAASSFGPEGMARGFRDLLRILPLPQAGRGALIGRIGAAGVALPFAIGTGSENRSPTGGPLALGVNRAESDPCSAPFTVHVDVFPPPDGRAVLVPTHVEAIPGVDATFFDRLPRRIADVDGNAGDMVNFLIVGTEAQMKQAFSTAGWVVVDADVKGALLSGLLSSLSKESYLTLPMSQLYLFGRPQDFGWAHAEPIKVAAARHHLRVWRAPFEVNGRTVWVGAATHDIGFERDQRNGGITHKIDPAIDLEREYVEQTLTGTGLVEHFTYVLPDNPLREARTATGGSFHSDGRVLVLQLATGLPSASTVPAR
ncbi:MAG: LssY C-terminal domain-containing protein [Vicinamibacterales bacterium]